MTGAVVVLFVLLGVVGPLLLYVLVRSEHDARERMDRERAERAARRDVDTDRDVDAGRDSGAGADAGADPSDRASDRRRRGT